MNRNFIRIVISLCMICVTCISCNTDTSNDTSNGPVYATYREAIAAEDFEAAHSILDKAKADIETLSRNEFDKKYGMDSYSGLRSAEEEVLQSEFNYLATQGTDEANKRLLVLLNTQPMKGTPRSEGQELAKDKSSSYTSMDDVHYYDGEYSHYIGWCSKYNARCLQILDIAITLDNKELAKMMVKAIKNDPEIISKRISRNSDRYDIYAHYTSKSKNEAISKYQDYFGKIDNSDK